MRRIATSSRPSCQGSSSSSTAATPLEREPYERAGVAYVGIGR